MLHTLVLLRDAVRIITEQKKMGEILEDFIQAIILFTTLPLDIVFDFYILCSERLQSLNASAFSLGFGFVRFFSSQHMDWEVQMWLVTQLKIYYPPI